MGMALSAITPFKVNKINTTTPEPKVEHNLEENIAFGGDDKWFFNTVSKRFDLSRGSRRKLLLDADDGIRNHRGILIDPDVTLLVVIDMQNFFLDAKFRDHSEGLKAVDPLLNVIAKCRLEGIQVCWLNWGVTDTDLKAMPPAVTRGFSRALQHERSHGWHVGLGAPLPAEQGGERCLYTGTWNADIYAPLKQAMTPADVRFDKARMSGMWSPDLPMRKWLLANGKKTLLFAGVNTDQCLLGTLSDAYNWGWDCILISDCAATMTGMGAHAVCDYNISTNMGFVTDSETFCQTVCA